MFARDGMMPWRTAVQNVEFGLEVRGIANRRAIAREWLRRVGLDKFEDHYRHELSQGMRQRVAVARTFAIEPDILLMDEPFGALDSQTRLLLQELFLSVWDSSKRTVLFVTHDLHEAIFPLRHRHRVHQPPRAGKVRGADPAAAPARAAGGAFGHAGIPRHLPAHLDRSERRSAAVCLTEWTACSARNSASPSSARAASAPCARGLPPSIRPCASSPSPTRTRRAREALAEHAGADFHSADNDEVIAHPEVNAVFVSTPEGEHAAPVCKALELGKPVLVEKPLALSLNDAEAILKTLKRTGGTLRVGYSRRFKECFLRAKEQMIHGRLGKVERRPRARL